MWSFIDGVFGTSGSTILNAAFALGLVLVLVVLALWALKFVFRTSSGVTRGRNRRLTIVDNLPVDQRRQLLIVRRDNVEHLVMIGGSQDVVIETGIPVEPAAVRQQMRRTMGAGGTRVAPGQRNPRATGEAATEPEGAAGHGAFQRLRDLGRGQPQRRGASLRHTGLMRGGRVEPAVIHDNSEVNGRPYRDSDRIGALNGHAASADGDANGQAPRDDDDLHGPYREDTPGKHER